MIGFEEGALDGFDDVDLGSPSIHHNPYDEGGVPSHINGSEDMENVKNARLRVPSEEAYQQAFLPVHTDTGTPYPCNQSDLEVHNAGIFRRPNNRPFVSAMEATAEIMLHNHVTRRVPPTELIAIDNLKKTIEAVEKRMDFGPDLVVKAFGDLDLLFFAGWLRDNVRVLWARASDHVKFSQATKMVWAVATHLPEQGKCLIMLNADLLLRQNDEEDPLRFILGTLLHEMCHAYDMVRCGHSLAKRRGHDEFFGTTIAIVHNRATRVLGIWAIGKDEPYRQHHFLPGEQTATEMALDWMKDAVLDVQDRVQEEVDVAAETAARGITAFKSWMLADKVAVD